jgi:hypothetical protein
MPALLIGTEAACADRALTPSAIAPAKLAISAVRDMSVSFRVMLQPDGAGHLDDISNLIH